MRAVRTIKTGKTLRIAIRSILTTYRKIVKNGTEFWA